MYIHEHLSVIFKWLPDKGIATPTLPEVSVGTEMPVLVAGSLQVHDGGVGSKGQGRA